MNKIRIGNTYIDSIIVEERRTKIVSHLYHILHDETAIKHMKASGTYDDTNALYHILIALKPLWETVQRVKSMVGIYRQDDSVSPACFDVWNKAFIELTEA